MRSNPPSEISLIQQAFTRLCHASGLESDAQIAAVIGMNRSAVWKVRSGQHRPSECFIAGVLRAWPEVDPRTLFRPVNRKPSPKPGRH